MDASGLAVLVALFATGAGASVVTSWPALVGQAAPPADPGGISGPILWVGLVILLIIFLVIVLRAFGRKRVDEEKKKELPEAPPPREALPDEERKPSLKEIKASRAARLPSEATSREALIKARQARKGASREGVQAAQEELVQPEPEPEESQAPGATAAPEHPEAVAEFLAPEATEPAAPVAPVPDEPVALEDAAAPAEPAGAAPAPPTAPVAAPPEAPAAPEKPAAPKPRLFEKTPFPALEKVGDKAKPAPAVKPAAPAARPAPAEKPAEKPDKAVAAEKPAPSPKSLEEGLEKTRSGFVGRLRGLFSKKQKLDTELVGELEEILLTADIGINTSTKLLKAVEKQLAGNGEVDSQQILAFLRAETARILRNTQRPLRVPDERPFIVLVIGVNGVGKTTTIGKLASRFAGQGHRVMLVAGDTFRAAAIDQLKVWGQRVGCEVFAGPEGRDPSAVVFDGIKAAQDAQVDVVLVDTAGRLHTKVNLVEELKKVRRVASKALEGAPHETLLVLDANTGQNAINQAQMFGKEIGVTGIALTKLDGTAKGGVIIGISDELGVPVQFIGIGEQIEDLREFDADEFVEAVF